MADQFEKWAGPEGLSLFKWGGKYAHPDTLRAYRAWMASRASIEPTLWADEHGAANLSVDDLAVGYTHGEFFEATPWLQLGPAQRFVVMYSPKGITAVKV